MNYLPLDYLGFAAAFIYALCMCGLCLYAVHSLWLLWRYKRSVHAHDTLYQKELDTALPEQLPKVLVQLPVFNERDVVQRAMDAVANLEWPHALLEIQVLDDSTDDCVALARAHAQTLQQRGVPIQVIHRSDRTGYKAGALEAGIRQSDAEYIAIFDADFVPDPDFLQQAIKPFLNNDKLGLVQGRWEHLNRNENILCKAQAIGIDGHFAIEQGARAWSGLPLNFNGTCGLWRRAAIDDAGGWEHDTLTEDMDLSYRAQLKDWQCTYRRDIAVRGEIPNHVDAWRSQQFRWAKGSIQTAIKLLGPIWTSSWSLTKKCAATFHMTHYLVHPLMLISLICAPIALGLCPRIPVSILMFGLLAFLVGIGAPFLVYAASQYVLHGGRGLRRMFYFPVLASIGTGIAISNTQAVSQAIQGIPSAFIRTPKKGDSTGSYSANRKSGFVEFICALWAGLGIAWGLHSDRPWIVPLLCIYVSGFAWVGILSFYSWFKHRPVNNFTTPRWLYLAGIILMALYGALALNPSTWVYAATSYTILGLFISAIYLAVVYVLQKHGDISRSGLAFIIVCGMVFRLCMLIGMPASDDLNRYIVEGRQAAYAQNPYVIAPHDPQARALLDQHLDTRITDAVNHPQWTAIYPPLSIGIETIVTHLRSTHMGIKISVFMTECLALLVMAQLLMHRGLPLALIALAWWNPVGPLWLSGEGHNDAWMMLFMLLGIWFWDKQSDKRGLAAMSCAALCKPFAAWALLPKLIKAPWHYWLIPIGLATLAYIPFLNAGTALFHSLGRFGSDLHFHGALEPIIRMFWTVGFHEEQSIRFATVCSLMLILFLGSALLIWRDHKGIAYHGAGDTAALCAKLFALVFLCLPTLYPWYFTPLVFLLPFIRQSWALIFWTAITPIFWLHGLKIAAHNGEWIESYWVTALAHLPAIIWLVSDIFMRSKPWQLMGSQRQVLSSNA